MVAWRDYQGEAQKEKVGDIRGHLAAATGRVERMLAT
jgi:hypothetical protein